jgi:CheY-like chemotaxis protein
MLNNINNDYYEYYNQKHPYHQVSLSVLIVDDNSDIAALIKRALTRAGLKVTAFTDPTRALEYFRVNCKDCSLIISDIFMPHMNGYELVKMAKEIDKNVKVILMSSLGIEGKEFHNVLPEVIIDGFLQKPFSTRKLYDMMEKAVVTS